MSDPPSVLPNWWMWNPWKPGFRPVIFPCTLTGLSGLACDKTTYPPTGESRELPMTLTNAMAAPFSLHRLMHSWVGSKDKYSCVTDYFLVTDSYSPGNSSCLIGPQIFLTWGLISNLGLLLTYSHISLPTSTHLVTGSMLGTTFTVGVQTFRIFRSQFSSGCCWTNWKEIQIWIVEPQ